MSIKVVIGAGYGDEGKGLATDYFCERLSKHGERVLNIKFNGGAQGGHTVERIVNNRYLNWIFGQYGAGTFIGADTYLGPKFQLDVELLLKEKEHLENMTDNIGVVYIDERCIVSLPIDKIFNQAIEEARGDLRHGSCGLGIFETFVRNNRVEGTALKVSDLLKEVNMKHTIDKITDKYIEVRRNQLCKQLFKETYDECCGTEEKRTDTAKNSVDYFNKILDEELRYINKLNENFINKVGELLNTDKIIILENINSIINNYNHFVFEGEQGLELSTHTKENGNHTTPSDTGVGNVIDIINESYILKELQKEFVFITRSYKTKHGAGEFREYSRYIDKCHKIVDFTNVCNDFQGSIRFGVANIERTKELIQREIKKISNLDKVKTSVMVTHLDQTFGFIVDKEDKEYMDFIRIPYKNIKTHAFGVKDNMYYSFGPRALDIITL